MTQDPRRMRQMIEDGLRRAAAALGPDAPEHVDHLRLRLPHDADADAVAGALRSALGTAKASQSGGEDGS